MPELSYLNLLFVFERDTTLAQVVRRTFHRHTVPDCQADEIHPHPARGMRQEPMAILQFHSEQRIRQCLHYRPFKGDGLFSRHVKISGSFSVINTVCSK